MSLRLEFKPEDCWLGVFWRHLDDWVHDRRTWHLWLCLLPMLPLHFIWTRPLKERL